MVGNKQYPRTERSVSWPLVAVGVITFGVAVAGLSLPGGSALGGEEKQLASLVSAQPVAQPDLPDFAAESVIPERKDQFYSFLMPMITEENARLAEKRASLLQWQVRAEAGETLSDNAIAQLTSLADRYYVDPEQPLEAVLAELLVRVDTLPPSLIVAQAANESAWGMSRFAREGNNLFGQWCFSVGCGLVPQSRPEGETYEVRSFDSPAHSVRSFIQNLNRHPSYEDLRQARAEMRENGVTVSGLNLAPHLLDYSTRREEYVEEIVSMINFNNLLDLDQ